MLFEDVPGTAKTVLARAIAAVDRGRRRLARPVHARPAADRRDRALGLQPAHARVRVPARPGLREHPARRRDQPGDAEDAVGAARGDGRAPGHGRRRHPRAARRRSSCSRPRTRSSTRARSRCPRRSSTASSSSDGSAIRGRGGAAVVREQRDGHPLDRLRPARRRARAASSRRRGRGRLRGRAASSAGSSSSCARRGSSSRSTVGASVRGEPRARAQPRAPGRCSTAATTWCPRTSRSCSLPVLGHRVVLHAGVPRRDARATPTGRAACALARLVPRPGAGARAGAPAGGRVSAELTPFPLVPRWRLVGSPFGGAASLAARAAASTSPARGRTGRGDNLAHDRLEGLGAALVRSRRRDEFVVREHFADEAPRVVMVADRRPSMGLYPRCRGWTSRRRWHALWRLVVASARRRTRARRLPRLAGHAGTRRRLGAGASPGLELAAHRSTAPERRARRRVRAARRRSPLAAAGHVRLRLLRLPRAAATRPGGRARSPTAGTSCR